MSHALGKLSIHGRPDPKPAGEIKEVGALDQKKSRQWSAGSQISPYYSADGRAVHKGKGLTRLRSLPKDSLTGHAGSETAMPTSLRAIAQKAASQKKYRFRNLFRLLDEELRERMLARHPSIVTVDFRQSIEHACTHSRKRRLQLHKLASRMSQALRHDLLKLARPVRL